eukprot:9084127-Pyramimonas_sp.AAC.1
MCLFVSHRLLFGFPISRPRVAISRASRDEVASCLVRFFEVPCRENFGASLSAGGKRGAIRIQPAWMLFFVLATDPLLRWLRRGTSPHVHLNLARADDLLFGLQKTLRDLGPILEGLLTFSQIANLRLVSTSAKS